MQKEPATGKNVPVPAPCIVMVIGVIASEFGYSAPSARFQFATFQ